METEKCADGMVDQLLMQKEGEPATPPVDPARAAARRFNLPAFLSRLLDDFLRGGARLLARLIWRPEMIGFDKIPQEGPVLLIANHVSYVDGVLLTAAINRPVRFIVDDAIYRLPVVHFFLKRNRDIPVFPKRESVQAMLDAVEEGLRAGDCICIFPEGQLTYTGHLSRFKPGIEWIIQKTPAPIYPIALKGLWGSVFSRKYRKAKCRWWPRSFTRKVTLICGDMIPPDQVKINQLQKVILQLKNSI